MEFLLTEIERALDAGLYYIALQSALTLPDICGALMSSDGEARKQNYIQWYDTYAKESGRWVISGEECYRFRCSCLHQLRTHHPKSEYSKIIFLHPDNNILRTHNCILFGALNIDLVIFCQNIISAVRKWEAKFKNDPLFQANYANMLRMYPKGYPPYVVGIPVIT